MSVKNHGTSLMKSAQPIKYRKISGYPIRMLEHGTITVMVRAVSFSQSHEICSINSISNVETKIYK
jgi:hypothetical protein